MIIYIYEDVASMETMRKHLEPYGLTNKDPEKLQDGSRVLGLEVGGGSWSPAMVMRK